MAETTFALILLFSVVYGQVVEEKYNIPSICDAQHFQTVERCCPAPRLFSADLLMSCLAEMGLEGSKENTTFDESNWSSGAGGIAIVINCMFKNQSLLSKNDILNTEAVFDKFLTSVNSAWKPVMQNALQNCTKSLAKVPLGATNDSKIANLGPALLMACTRSSLTLNCPQGVIKNSDECTKSMEVLKKCDPFITEDAAGGWTWIQGILKWIAGPKETWAVEGGRGAAPKPGFFGLFLGRLLFPLG